jgi:hypothetical protein
VAPEEGEHGGLDAAAAAAEQVLAVGVPADHQQTAARARASAPSVPRIRLLD